MASSSETSEEGPVHAGDTPIDGLLSSSRFLQRLSKMNIVDSAMTTASCSYNRVKEATPSMVRPAVDSAELTALHVVNQMTAIVQSLPLPLHFADELACAGLDRLEHLAHYKEDIIERLHQMTPDRLKSAPLTDEEKSFYFELIGFISAAKEMAAGGLRNNLSFFIDAQLALLERVEGAMMTLHATEFATRIDSKYDMDFAGRIQKVKHVFEDVIKQQNEIVNWALGGRLEHNPLEPVWKHLLNGAQKLTPNKDVIKAFRDKVGLFKDILKGAIEQIKLAAKDPEQAFADVKANVLGSVVGIASAWLPLFAINGLRRLTGLQLVEAPSSDADRGRVTDNDNDKTNDSSNEQSLPLPEIQTNTFASTTNNEQPTRRKSVNIIEPFEMMDVSVQETCGNDEDEPEAQPETQDETERKTQIEVIEEEEEEAEDKGQETFEDSTETGPENRRRNRNRRRKNKRAAENSNSIDEEQSEYNHQFAE